MSIEEDLYNVKKNVREPFIKKRILSKLPRKIREESKNTVDRIAFEYIGLDRHALSILAYAAERGRFDEFVQKLDNYFERDLGFVAPEMRRCDRIPGAQRAQEFFSDCYESLGIEPRGV